MYWTTMHFAAGMGCAGIMAVMVCAVARRGWRWLPVVMTLGGIWAVLPDVPPTLRASLGVTGGLASPALEAALDSIGNLFFFHGILDATARDHMIAGGIIIVLLYNLAILLLMVLEERTRLGVDSYGVRRNLARQRRLNRRFARSNDVDALPYDAPVIARVRSSHLARTG